MSDELIFVLTLVSALGCGLVAGIFFAFSAFVMRALGRQPPAHGIAAMQAINVDVLNPVFFAAFFGTAATCAAVAVSALLRWQATDTYRLIGSVLYLIGTIGVTMACNVPWNNALAPVNPTSAESAELWSRYVRTWTAWNHVRTVAALLAAASLTIALCR